MLTYVGPPSLSLKTQVAGTCDKIGGDITFDDAYSYAGAKVESAKRVTHKLISCGK